MYRRTALGSIAREEYVSSARIIQDGGERTMLAIECPCGHHLEGEDEDELLRRAREHVDRDHPEMNRSDDDLRARIAADAYEVGTET
jgi:predicted small metal-binding protein